MKKVSATTTATYQKQFQINNDVPLDVNSLLIFVENVKKVCQQLGVFFFAEISKDLSQKFVEINGFSKRNFQLSADFLAKSARKIICGCSSCCYQYHVQASLCGKCLLL